MAVARTNFCHNWIAVQPMMMWADTCLSWPSIPKQASLPYCVRATIIDIMGQKWMQQRKWSNLKITLFNCMGLSNWREDSVQPLSNLDEGRRCAWFPTLWCKTSMLQTLLTRKIGWRMGRLYGQVCQHLQWRDLGFPRTTFYRMECRINSLCRFQISMSQKINKIGSVDVFRFCSPNPSPFEENAILFTVMQEWLTSLHKH